MCDSFLVKYDHGKAFSVVQQKKNFKNKTAFLHNRKCCCMLVVVWCCCFAVVASIYLKLSTFLALGGLTHYTPAHTRNKITTLTQFS